MTQRGDKVNAATAGDDALQSSHAERLGAEPVVAVPSLVLPKKTGRTMKGIFLPYQLDWINDESPRKLGDKSRRTGWTWSEAYDAVSRRQGGSRNRDRDYWFSSADESAAAEFIEYCRFFQEELFGKIADVFIEHIEDPTTGRVATAFCLRCPNGRKIVAMSSNPRRFRSKGGDVGLDEFAFHDNQHGMYGASSPVTTWGGTLRVFSTPNGEGNEYDRMVKRCRKLLNKLGFDPNQPPRLAWDTLFAASQKHNIAPIFSYHRVTIVDAIAQGIVDKINEVGGTTWTEDGFLDDCRAKSLDHESFLQEYMCEPAANAAAWLTFAIIEAAEHDDCPQPQEPLTGYEGGVCHIGVDVGAERDLTVIWVLEPVGDVLYTRQIVEIEKTSLPEQQAILGNILRNVRWASCTIDQSAIGLGLMQYSRSEFGERVEGVQFTNPAKQAMAVAIKQAFEDRAVRIPANNGVLRDDLHSIRKTVTQTGLERFDAPRGPHGHADRFWALALAIEGSKTQRGGHFWAL